MGRRRLSLLQKVCCPLFGDGTLTNKEFQCQKLNKRFKTPLEEPINENEAIVGQNKRPKLGDARCLSDVRNNARIVAHTVSDSTENGVASTYKEHCSFILKELSNNIHADPLPKERLKTIFCCERIFENLNPGIITEILSEYFDHINCVCVKCCFWLLFVSRYMISTMVVEGRLSYKLKAEHLPFLRKITSIIIFFYLSSKIHEFCRSNVVFDLMLPLLSFEPLSLMLSDKTLDINILYILTIAVKSCLFLANNGSKHTNFFYLFSRCLETYHRYVVFHVSDSCDPLHLSQKKIFYASATLYHQEIITCQSCMFVQQYIYHCYKVYRVLLEHRLIRISRPALVLIFSGLMSDNQEETNNCGFYWLCRFDFLKLLMTEEYMAVVRSEWVIFSFMVFNTLNRFLLKEGFIGYTYGDFSVAAYFLMLSAYIFYLLSEIPEFCASEVLSSTYHLLDSFALKLKHSCKDKFLKSCFLLFCVQVFKIHLKSSCKEIDYDIKVGDLCQFAIKNAMGAVRSKDQFYRYYYSSLFKSSVIFYRLCCRNMPNEYYSKVGELSQLVLFDQLEDKANTVQIMMQFFQELDLKTSIL